MKKVLSFAEKHQSSISLLLIIGILVVLNVLSADLFIRADLTANGRYSISEGTKNIIKNLDDVVTIRTYFSEELPSHLVVFRQQVRDILDEYRAYSKGNVQIETVIPKKDDPEFQREMQIMGIPQIQINVVEKDAYQVQSAYLGMGVFYGDKKEIIPIVQSAARLEYDITSSIVKLTSGEQKIIGFTQNSKEHSIGTMASDTTKTPYNSVAQGLAQLYEVRNISLQENENVFRNMDTLVVAGSESMDEKTRFAIDQFLARGGRAVFLVDAVSVSGVQGSAIEETGVEAILENFGLTVNKDLVADKISETAVFQRGNIQYILPYAFWPKLINDNFSQDNPIVSSLESIVLPWASSIGINEKEGFSYETLATTHQGWKVAEPFDLDPNNMMFVNPEALTKAPMIVMASGKYTSIYSETALPAELTEDEKFIKESENETRILLVGDSDFIDDSESQQFPQNLVFFLNAIDYLTLGDDLSSIRTKSVSEMLIKKMSENEKYFLKTIGIWLVPIVVAGGGTFYLIKRNRRKYALND